MIDHARMNGAGAINAPTPDAREPKAETSGHVRPPPTAIHAHPSMAPGTPLRRRQETRFSPDVSAPEVTG